MKVHLKWVSVFFCILWLSGCRSTVNTVEYVPSSLGNRILITDTALAKSVHLVAIDENGQNPLKVQVKLENTTNSVKHFNYKFEWFDENGTFLTQSALWRPCQIEGRETICLTAVAPTNKATNFKLKLLKGKK